LGASQKFNFENVEFKTPNRYINGDVEYVEGYMNLVFREVAWAGGKNF
jgi:hypothetical protein